jgi:hypothetical protein
MKLLSTCAVAVLALATALPATASMVVNITEQGDDVAVSYDGTLSLDGLNRYNYNYGYSYQEFGAYSNYIYLYGMDDWGYAIGSATSFDFVGPTNGNWHNSAAKSGDAFGVYADTYGNGNLYFDNNYVAGDQITGSLTFANKSLSDFGFADGTSYSFTFGNTGNGDTVTFNYGSAAQFNSAALSAVPLPAGAPLLLAGLGLFAGLRARKKAQAA